jgi:hypothetical protein
MGAGEAGGAGVGIYDFDPVNFRLGAKQTLPLLPIGGYPSTSDLIWSHTEPDILYAHNGTSLWRFNARSRSYSLVFDLSTRLPAGSYFSQTSLSTDGDVFGGTLQQSGTWAKVGYMAYRRSTDKIIFLGTEAIDEVKVDKTGGYLLVATNEAGVGKHEVRIVDLNTGQTQNLTDDAPDHAPMHYDVGSAMAVGNANYLVGITARSLATPHSYTKILDLSSERNYGGFHLSMLADNEAWALVSFYTEHVNGVMQGEVVQVSTDGAGRVRRLFHHRAVFDSYYDTPRANISRDGRYVAFSSNWGVKGGRHDMFIARIPPAPGGVVKPAAVPAASRPRRVSTLNGTP